MNEALLRQVAAEIQSAGHILITSHVRPDGDAIGSILGLGLALQTTGKKIQMVSSDGVPVSCQHLAGSDMIVSRPTNSFDISIVLDCSDIGRAGSVLNGAARPDLNIDHHITNEYFARINLVDTQAVATAQILAELIPALGLPMTQPVAAALLNGIVTDTLGFRTSNMTAQALRVAANLVDLGVDVSGIYQRSLSQRSFEAAHYWGAGLSRLARQGRILWTSLTIVDRKSTGYSGKDDADLINTLSNISGFDVAIIFVEQSYNRVKVSWRAQNGVDISQLAASFGGGGHPAAAGAEIHGPLDKVCAAVLEATQQLLDFEEPLVASPNLKISG